MKKTFIATVFNEEKTISKLLDSLLEQTIIPDEIVFVDAGSKDKTRMILEEYSKEMQVPFYIFKKKGNRSKGRNYAIKKATGSVIVVTDAGCILKKDWFEKITKPFEKKSVDVVAGFYMAQVNNTFEKCLSTYTCVMPEKVTGDFLPSSRSIAFKKSVWKKVKGYPEYLNTCEDLVFARKLKREGLNFYVEKRAIVFWPQRKNLWEAFQQFLAYAKGDGEAHYVRRSTPLLFARFTAFFIIVLWPGTLVPKLLILATLTVLYLLWSIKKNFKYASRWEALFYLPALQITSDIAVFFGMTYGYIRSIILK